jgi:tripartite-type tricarboxylate transporter receptor subunit TctC
VELLAFLMLHVPNESAPGALLDVLTGRVDITFANLLDAQSQIEGGKVKVLGVGSAQRFAGMPNVPTLSESLPGFVSETWYAIVAPPGVASGVADRIAAAVAEVTKLPDVEQKLREMNVSPVSGPPNEGGLSSRRRSPRASDSRHGPAYSLPSARQRVSILVRF